jgi:catechol 2,3-dioxygenase-like lactoylglutathione lyase family enzyme
MNGASAGVNRMDHVGVLVPDASKASAQFEVALGLMIDEDEVLEDVGVRLVYLVGRDGPGFCDLQLVEPLRDGPLRAHLTERGQGPHHVCFTTDDIDGSLVGLGDSEAKVFRGGKGRRACFLSERVGGVLVEIIETSSAQLTRSL